ASPFILAQSSSVISPQTLRALPALAALERGDLDVNSEIWLNSVADPWKQAEAKGNVKRIGDIYMGGAVKFDGANANQLSSSVCRHYGQCHHGHDGGRGRDQKHAAHHEYHQTPDLALSAGQHHRQWNDASDLGPYRHHARFFS
ncbi:glycine betaine/choline/proline transport system substrate-binding protein, partial [Alcaligenes faecalis subsp. faecalis NCIB 8687]